MLHEALRLCPPGAALARVAVDDIEVEGHRVDAIQRDPTLWERALEFDLDRFDAENSNGRDRWQYLPFGAGTRSCIGDHFAMLEAALALATIVESAEIDSVTCAIRTMPVTTVAAARVLAPTTAFRRAPGDTRHHN
ncbi:cytochrome P450 [Mycobacterium sp. URHB0021]